MKPKFTIKNCRFENEGKTKWYISRFFPSEIEYLYKDCTVHNNCGDGWYATKEEAERVLYFYNQGLMSVNLSNIYVADDFLTAKDMEI
jgi:hypothetical protein